MNATNTTCRSIFKMQLLAGALVATFGAISLFGRQRGERSGRPDVRHQPG